MKLLILSFFSLTTLSCSIPGSLSQQNGYIGFNIKFPEPPGFSVKAIPDSTEKINIKLTSKDNPALIPITKTITREEANNKVKIEEIPPGVISVEVNAVNHDNKVVASLTKDTTIVAGKITNITMELKSLLSKLKIALDNYPANGNVAFAEIKPKGGKAIYKQFQGSELDLGEVETGAAPVRVTVFTNDATPLAVSNTSSIDVGKSDTAHINLEKLELPATSDLPATGLPTQLLEKLTRALISFPGNTPPKLGNINVVVKGPARPLTFSSTSPLCLNTGDKLDINITATDGQNDQVNYIWGLTSTSNGQSRMTLFPERGPVLSRVVDFPVGNYSVGVIITDKMSFVGPTTLYVRVQAQPCG